MKNILKLASLMLMLLCVNLYNAPVSFLPYQVTQPDGTELNIFASGDEFYNWLHDANGYTIMQNFADDWYYYADQSGDSLIPSKIKVRNNYEPKGLEKWLKFDNRFYQERIEEFQKQQDDLQLRLDKTGDVLNGPAQRHINNIVICIRFADDTVKTYDYAKLNIDFNSPDKLSMRSYIQEMSYNKLIVSTTIYPTPTSEGYLYYTDTNKRGYFEPDNGKNGGYKDQSERSTREFQLVERVFKAIESQIPEGIDYDFDKNGILDNFCLIVQGKSGAWNVLLWPHKWSVESRNIKFRNLKLGEYNLMMEDQMKTRGVAVVSHEFLHTLGAPDFYDYTNKTTPVGEWDIMAATQNTPQQSGAYIKHKYFKFIDSIPEITQSGVYKINSIDKPTNNCYKLPSYKSNEYYVVEFRNKKHRYDANLPQSGILVYRVNPMFRGSTSNTNHELYIYRENGKPDNINGNIKRAAYSVENKATLINDTTNPMAFLSDGNYGGLNILNVSKVDTMMSFEVKFDLKKPLLIMPTKYCNIVVPNVRVEWKKLDLSKTTRVQISNKADFSELVMDNYLQNVNQINTSLSQNSTYYIRLKSVMPSDSSDWSDAVEFSTFSDSHRRYFLESFQNNLYLPRDWKTGNSSNTSAFESNAWQVVDSPIKSANSNNNISKCLGATYFGETAKKEGKNTLIVKPLNPELLTDKILCFDFYKEKNNNGSKIKVWTNDKETILGAKLLKTLSVDLNQYPEYDLAEFIRISLRLDGASASDKYVIFSVEADDESNVILPSAYIDNVELLAIYNVPTRPVLFSPGNYTSNIQLGTEFTWSNVGNNSMYEIQIANDERLDNIIDFGFTDKTSFTSSKLKANSVYYWRVRSSNELGSTEWSNNYSFSTISARGKIQYPDSLLEKIVIGNQSNTASVKLLPTGNFKIGNRNITDNDLLLIYYLDANRNEKLAGYIAFKSAKSFTTLYADNPSTPEKDGFAPQEAYIYKIWDSERGLFVTPTFINDNTTIAQYNTNQTTIIEKITVYNTKMNWVKMSPGWNLISLYYNAYCTNLDQLLSSRYMSNLRVSFVVDSTGKKFVPNYLNEINYLQSKQAYLVYNELNEPVVWNLMGELFSDAEKAITLNKKGWHWVPYLNDKNMPTEAFFSKILNSNFVIIKDLDGNIYYPPYFKTLEQLTPGKAYLVYTNGAMQVDYAKPSSAIESVKYKMTRATGIDIYSNSLPLRNNNNTAIAMVEIEGMQKDQILLAGIPNTNKLQNIANEKLGKDSVTYLCLSGQDLIYPNTGNQYLNGVATNEEIALFKAVPGRVDVDNVIELTEVYDVLNDKKLDALRFQSNGLYHVKARYVKKSLVADAQNTMLSLYPNPATESIYVQLNGEEKYNFQLEIVDMSGNTVVKTANSLQANIVDNRVGIDVRDLPSGLYNVVIRSNQEVKTAKFMIVR